jgi:hypothetical protein
MSRWLEVFRNPEGILFPPPAKSDKTVKTQQDKTQRANFGSIDSFGAGVECESHPAPDFSHEETALIRKKAKDFQKHLNKPGPHLFLVLDGVKIREGNCLTCGERPVAGRLGVRCRICGIAARIALSGEKGANK